MQGSSDSWQTQPDGNLTTLRWDLIKSFMEIYVYDINMFSWKKNYKVHSRISSHTETVAAVKL